MKRLIFSKTKPYKPGKSIKRDRNGKAYLTVNRWQKEYPSEHRLRYVKVKKSFGQEIREYKDSVDSQYELVFLKGLRDFRKDYYEKPEKSERVIRAKPKDVPDPTSSRLMIMNPLTGETYGSPLSEVHYNVASRHNISDKRYLSEPWIHLNRRADDEPDLGSEGPVSNSWGKVSDAQWEDMRKRVGSYRDNKVRHDAPIYATIGGLRGNYDPKDLTGRISHHLLKLGFHPDSELVLGSSLTGPWNPEGEEGIKTIGQHHSEWSSKT